MRPILAWLVVLLSAAPLGGCCAMVRRACGYDGTAEPQQITLPWRSAMVTTVLLNVARICATPCAGAVRFLDFAARGAAAGGGVAGAGAGAGGGVVAMILCRPP